MQLSGNCDVVRGHRERAAGLSFKCKFEVGDMIQIIGPPSSARVDTTSRPAVTNNGTWGQGTTFVEYSLSDRIAGECNRQLNAKIRVSKERHNRWFDIVARVS